VQVRGCAYGPYRTEQLSGFIAEGRVRPTTLVSNSPDGAWVQARRVLGLMKPEHKGAANVFVHAEIMSDSWHRFMTALNAMGLVCELAPGLWLLRTPLSAGLIRNTLSQTLERGDRIIVIDATRDRLAWFNLGMETDARIARVWNGPQTASA
jgi:hypothetical protein